MSLDFTGPPAVTAPATDSAISPGAPSGPTTAPADAVGGRGSTPPFTHAPMRGRYQMIAWELDDLHPLEFFFAAKGPRAAIRQANDAAIWQKAHFVAVRDGDGAMLYDGPVFDALGRPIFFLGERTIYSTYPEHAALAAAYHARRDAAQAWAAHLADVALVQGRAA